MGRHDYSPPLVSSAAAASARTAPKSSSGMTSNSGHDKMVPQQERTIVTSLPSRQWLRSFWSYLFVFISLLATMPRPIHAAHSQKRVAVRTRVVHVYDRSITTFDPATGRLLQVEYGAEAANRGSPIVAMLVNETAYIGVVSSDRPIVHRLDHHLFLVTAGLAGDAAALAAELRLGAARHVLEAGEPMTVGECAQSAAAWQHALTKQPGARPLGITALVVGHDDDDDSQARLYRCHPGGTLEDVWYAAAGQNAVAAMKKLQQGYASLRQQQQDQNDIAQEQAVIRTLLAALKASTERDNKQSWDVWIIRPPDKNTAIASRVTCIQGLVPTVSKKDLQKTLQSLQQQQKHETNSY